MGRRAGFTAESRFFWKHQLPGLADSHVRETASFPDLLIRMSGKPPASRTCRFACQGNRQLPGLAESAERRPPALLQVDTCREEHSGSQRIRPCSPERTELLGVLPAWGS